MREPLRLRLLHQGRSPSSTYLAHVFASAAIRHHIYRLSLTLERGALVAMRLRYHDQRSLAIRALKDNSARAEKKTPYLLIVGVAVFVFAEVNRVPFEIAFVELRDLPPPAYRSTYRAFVLAAATLLRQRGDSTCWSCLGSYLAGAASSGSANKPRDEGSHQSSVI